MGQEETGIGIECYLAITTTKRYRRIRIRFKVQAAWVQILLEKACKY